MAAAIRPNNTCRNPEYQILFPVNNVMADPIKNNPVALAATLMIIAVMPVVNIKGITGITAPIPNNMND